MAAAAGTARARALWRIVRTRGDAAGVSQLRELTELQRRLSLQELFPAAAEMVDHAAGDDSAERQVAALLISPGAAAAGAAAEATEEAEAVGCGKSTRRRAAARRGSGGTPSGAEELEDTTVVAPVEVFFSFGKMVTFGFLPLVFADASRAEGVAALDIEESSCLVVAVPSALLSLGERGYISTPSGSHKGHGAGRGDGPGPRDDNNGRGGTQLFAFCGLDDVKNVRFSRCKLPKASIMVQRGKRRIRRFHPQFLAMVLLSLFRALGLGAAQWQNAVLHACLHGINFGPNCSFANDEALVHAVVTASNDIETELKGIPAHAGSGRPVSFDQLALLDASGHTAGAKAAVSRAHRQEDGREENQEGVHDEEVEEVARKARSQPKRRGPTRRRAARTDRENDSDVDRGNGYSDSDSDSESDDSDRDDESDQQTATATSSSSASKPMNGNLRGSSGEAYAERLDDALSQLATSIAHTASAIEENEQHRALLIRERRDLEKRRSRIDRDIQRLDGEYKTLVDKRNVVETKQWRLQMFSSVMRQSKSSAAAREIFTTMSTILSADSASSAGRREPEEEDDNEDEDEDEEEASKENNSDDGAKADGRCSGGRSDARGAVTRRRPPRADQAAGTARAVGRKRASTKPAAARSTGAGRKRSRVR